MNSNWIKFLDTINEEINSLESNGSDVVFFRGHSNNNYKPLPTLFRSKKRNIEYLESVLFYDFVSMAGVQIKNDTSWEILFTMRHYGVPTRLLDWTISFANALYFAISDKKLNKPHVWILDPYKLNSKNEGFPEGLINPNYDLDYDYFKMFISNEHYKDVKKPTYPMSLYPPRNNPRIFAQQGVFTIHGTEIYALDQLAPECVKKIYIPDNCIEDAQNFLMLAGLNEYSVYPDLGGLANYLKKKHKI